VRSPSAARSGDGTSAPEWVAESMLEAAQSLRVDLAAAQITSAMRGAGVRSILLKGAALRRLLYSERAQRRYWDVDLLVSPDQWAAAGEQLRGLGFGQRYGGERAGLRHADVWEPRAGSGIPVDLHWTLVGVEAEPAECWRLLAGSTNVLRLCGEDIEVLPPEGNALQVALHAAQHGPNRPQGMADLERALDRFDGGTWRAASGLAEELGASEMFSAGLRLLPAGEALATSLGLSRHKSVRTAVMSGSPPPLALGVEKLAQTEGLGAKLRLLARETVPSREFMRTWWPRARHRRRWLVAAYLWRPLWLLVQAGPSVVAWRRASKEARTS
jgi:hypothetical protein